MRWLPRLLVAVLACSSGAGAAGEPAASPPEQPEHEVLVGAERALIDKGISQRKVEDDWGARAAFRKAWSLRGSPEALAQLALAEQALGLWVEAHTHLLVALEQPDHSWIRSHRAALDAALEEMRSRLGRLEVYCNVSAAAVSIDGTVAGTTPFAAPLYLPAGRSVVQVSAQGYFDVTRQVQIDAGALSRLDVTLTPHVPQSTPTNVDGAPTRNDPHGVGSGTRNLLEYGSFGLAALSLAVGVSGYVMREINVRQYNDDKRCDSLPGVSRSQECSGPFAAWRLGEGLAIGGFAAAGVFGAVGLYLWFDGPSVADRAASACGVGLGSVACGGRF